MTKTHANEPGFVQLPDGWLAVEMKAAEAEIAKWPAGLRASFESLFRASVPPVPWPAHGDAREALEPFALLGGHLSDRDREAGLIHRAAFWDCPSDLVLYDDHMGAVITVGDVRRARAAYDAVTGDAQEIGR